MRSLWDARHWPSTEASPFAAQLKHLRLMRGLSQEALAERASMSVRGLSDLERGIRRAPQPSTITRLAQALCLDGSDRAAFVAAARHGDDPTQQPVRTDAQVPDLLPLGRPGADAIVFFVLAVDRQQCSSVAEALGEVLGSPLVCRNRVGPTASNVHGWFAGERARWGHPTHHLQSRRTGGDERIDVHDYHAGPNGAHATTREDPVGHR